MTSICFVGNPTSISYLIGNALTARGYEVDVIGSGSIFQTNKLGTVKKKPSLLHRAVRKYANPLYREAVNSKEYDIEVRAFNKPIVNAKHRTIVYHGSDLRNALWKDWDTQIHYPCFYTTIDLGLRYLDLSKRAVWLPRCFVEEYFKPEPRLKFDGKHLTVGFFPTNPKMEEKGWIGKGTQLLYDAVKVIESRGIEVELLTPEKTGFVAHGKMSELYKRCHVVADQFNPDVGQYGIISLEAITMNRPPVCHVWQEHFEYSEIKEQITNCEPNPESIANSLLEATWKPVNPIVPSVLYNPAKSADVMENAFKKWGFLN